MISKIQQALFQYRRKKFGEFGLGYIVSQKQLLQLKTKSFQENYDVKSSPTEPCPYITNAFRNNSFIEEGLLVEDQIARAHT